MVQAIFQIDTNVLLPTTISPVICSHLLFWEEESDQSDQCQEKSCLRSLTKLPYISDDQPLGLSLDTENMKIKPFLW